MAARNDNRPVDKIRPLRFHRFFTQAAPGSVLVESGRTRVLCTASVEGGVPRWLVGKRRGWMTAEYSMLPAAGGSRKPREIARGRPDGRSQEIQRLIGRAMRAVVHLEHLGDHTIWLDCDVIEADGGTRTAAINGAYVALCDALYWMEGRKMIARNPLFESIAAISVGVVDGEPRLDLDYAEDSNAEVDMNVVMTGSGKYIEIQGAAEEAPFPGETLEKLLMLARSGIEQVTRLQKEALSGKSSAAS